MNLSEMAGAVFSEDRKYRYLLWRKWDASKPMLNYLLMNCSIADATANDPTVTRDMKRAQQLGYGGMYHTNAFAYIETDSSQLARLLKSGTEIVGPENDAWIKKISSECPMTICGWGLPGSLGHRDKHILAMLSGMPLYYLKLTANGQPMHPLYISYETKPVLWLR